MSSAVTIAITVNGESRKLEVPAATLLVEIIREHLGLSLIHI